MKEGRPRAAFFFSTRFLTGAALAAGVVVFFFPVLFQGHLFLERDFWSFYLAAKSLVPRLARAAHGLPFWNPFFGMGQPFAANPEHEIWHPLTWLFLVLPFGWAFRLQVLLPVLGAGVSMAFLLRTLRRSAPAAAFGAVVWAFGGYVSSTINLLPILFAVAVLPAVVALAVRAARRPSPRSVGLLALAFGLECLAGEPSTLLMTPVLVVAALVADRRALRGGIAGVARVAAGGALGALVAAATLLPGAHLLSKTLRGEGFPADMLSFWSMPAARLVELVLPYALGHVESGKPWFWGSALYEIPDLPFLYSLYGGLPAAVLAVVGAWGLARARRRAFLAWAGSACVGVLVALGPVTPVWTVLRAIHPVFRGLRYPEKAALLLMFPLVVLAGIGFDLVWRRAAARRRAFAGTAVLVTAVLSFGAALFVYAVLRGPTFWYAWPIEGRIAPFLTEKLPHDFGMTAVIGASLLLLLRPGRTTRVRPAVLIALALADLVLANARLNATGTRANLVPPTIIELRARRIDGPVFHAASWLFGSDRGHWFLRPPIPVWWGIPMALEEDYDVTELVWTHRSSLAIQALLVRRPQAGEPLLRRRGIVAVLQLRPGVHVERGEIVLPPGEAEALDVRWVPGPKGFAFFAASVHPLQSENAWPRAAARLGAGAAHAVLLREDDARGLPRYPSPGEVRAVRRTPDDIALDVNVRGPEPGILAVNQTWDEFWRATVDGAPVPLLRADWSLQAIRVPPGDHAIRLVYVDPWVLAGAAISAAAFAAAALLVLLGKRRRA